MIDANASEMKGNTYPEPVREPASAISRDILVNVTGNRSERITHRVGSHVHQYYGIAVRGDKPLMITANRDRTARLWDVASGQCLMVFSGHTDEVRRAAFTPDGKRVITAGNDSTLRVWDPSTGECLAVLGGHEGDVLAVTVTPDGEYVVSGGSDRTLRLWSTATGACAHILKTRAAGIAKALATADGAMLIALDFNGDVYRWSFAGLDNPLPVITGGFEDRLSDIALTASGTIIGTAFSGGLYNIDIKTGNRKMMIPLLPYRPYKIAVTPDDSRLVAICHPKVTILVINRLSKKIEKEFNGHMDDVTGMALTSDGRTLCTVSLDYTCRIWDITSGKPRRAIKSVSNVSRLAMSDDGTYIAAVDASGHAKVWNITDASCRTLSRNASSVVSHGRPGIIATGHTDGKISLRDVREDNRHVSILEGHKSPVNCLVSFEAGTRLASAANDGTVKLWDTDRKTAIRSYPVPGKTAALAVDEHGRRFAAYNLFEDCINIYDAGSGKRLAALQLPEGPASQPCFIARVRGMYFLPGSKGLVACTSGGRVLVWNPSTFEIEKSLEDHGCTIVSMTRENDERHILTGTSDGEIKRWDLKSGRRDIVYSDKGRAAGPIALTPDERLICAAFEDGTVRFIERKGSVVLCAALNIDNGFFWFTPPEEHAPDGWVWTNRDELLHVVRMSPDGRVLGAVPLDDARRRAYCATRNNPVMVKERLKGVESYARSAGRYLGAVAQMGEDMAARSLIMLPKGDLYA